MKKNFMAVLICCLCFIYAPLLFAQVQDMHLSVEQFTKINAAKENMKKIKKGVTKAKEISKWFGKEQAGFYIAEPIGEDDSPEFFAKFLKQFIPEQLKPELYPFPGINQKVLIYIFPWVFEHPVPCSSRKGECVTAENLVIVVTINKKTGIVEEFMPFDFHFEHKLEQNSSKAKP